MTPPRRRVAFLVCHAHLPRWQAKAVRQVLAIPGIELTAIGIPLQVRPAIEKRGLRGYMERRSLATISTTALVPDNISDILTTTQVIEFAQDPMALSGALEQLIASGAENIISFLPLESSGTKKHSMPIWQFLLDNHPLDPRSSVALNTALLSLDRTSASLVDQHGRIGIESVFELKSPNGCTTLDRILHGASWLPSKLLIDGLPKTIKTSINKQYNTIYQSNIANELSIFLRAEWMRIKAERQKTTVDGSWNIGILHQPITALLEEDPSMNIRWLSPPSTGNQRMEPFGYTAPDGQLNVLYRRKDREKPYDTIARLRPKSDNVLKRSRSMLTTQGDLEYPFILERLDGTYVLISYPHQERTELFKVDSTNNGLDHVNILINRALSSPTLTEFNDRWWLFGTDPDSPDTVLLAFHSAQFDGPYTPHALNPLKIDPIGTRPAGTMFRNGTDLWRPTVDRSEPANPAVILNKVEVLTPETFQETAGNRIAGFRGTVYGHGVRTLCGYGDITLIDGIRLSNPPPRPQGQGVTRSRTKQGE